MQLGYSAIMFESKVSRSPSSYTKQTQASIPLVCHFSSSQTSRRREGIKALVANVFKSVRYLGGIQEVGAVCVCVMVDEMGPHMATITHTAPLIAADLPPRLQPSHL